ncbi:organic cation transporter protein-like [Penaeus japonicus]|uniref:organic cation transporter protein-like n=1 Tax=Penaeus japonicus TaxID=27405 RepID=UPI001C70DC22|nr:organic cation transporter protein-like [Penaeus japonicus]
MTAAEQGEAKKVEDVKTFEDLLRLVGTRGRWNIILFFLCAYSTFVSPMQSLSYQFLGATPNHWCHVEPLVSAGWTQEQILSIAIPVNNETGKPEHCLMYNSTFSTALEQGYEWALRNREAFNQSGVVSCKSRDFNTSQYESTVTTEWDLVCDRRVLYSTTQAAVQAGKLVGYVFLGYLLDTFGRRPVTLACSALSIVSGFLAAASPNVEFYIFLKIIITCMMSGVYLGCFISVMEACSAKQRDYVGPLFVLPWALGYMVVPGIAYLIRDWKPLQAALTTPALLLVVFYFLLPESPRWLILGGRHKQALEVLQRAARLNGRTLPSDEQLLAAMERIAHSDSSKESQEKSKESLQRRALKVVETFFVLLTTSSLRLRALVAFFCWFAASMVYYGVALNATNLSADPYVYIFLGGLLEVPSYILLWPAIKYIGRVKSLAILYFVCGASIIVVMFLMLYVPTVPVGVTMFFSLCGKMAITAAFHLIWLFTAELFPTKYRSLAVGEASVCARVGSICSPYINDILGEVVTWAPSALFGIVSLVAAGLSLLLPETKNRELPETADFFEKKGVSNAAYEVGEKGQEGKVEVS